MAYTVKELAELSGVTIRTLHHYDEIGLLKPAYYGGNGYRYYEEEQLFLLQQILFFREMDFDLEQIKKLMGKGRLDKVGALKEHRRVVKAKITRYQQLIKTIDRTVEHLTKGTKMANKDMYRGFDPQKQAEHEQYLLSRFGAGIKQHLKECEENVKNWKERDWEKSTERFASICKRLVQAMDRKLLPSSNTVQELIKEHCDWLKSYWIPNRESYFGHAKLIVDSELRQAYAKYHDKLPEFIAEGIQLFANRELA